jgi:predicted transcriptional regulator
MKITGNYIKKLRKERGISQQKLAELVGVSQAHIAKIENEKVDPRLSTVNKILSVLSNFEKSIKCKDVMFSDVIFVKHSDPVKKVIDVMRSHAISQVPVFDRDRQIGSIRESTLFENMDKNLDKMKAKDIMEKPFPVVDENDDIEIVKPLLEFHPAVLVYKKGKLRGIITKSDLLEIR